MAGGALARRYAQALQGIGQEAGLVDRFAAELESFAETLDLGGGMLRSALENPGLSVGERRGVLQAVLGQLGLHPMVNNFLNLLIDKNRLVIFDDIRRAYQKMADELAGRVRATVTTAAALSPDDSRRVVEVLTRATGREVVIEFGVDPDLIGGIVARVGDTLFDASIRARLHDMRETLSR